MKQVQQMTREERVAEIVRRSANYMPAEVWWEVQQMLTPEALSVMAGVTTAWAMSHFFGVGEIADVVLLVLGGATLGVSAMEVGKELVEFALSVGRAQKDEDLENGAKHFAKATVMGGVTVLSAVFFMKRPNVFRKQYFRGSVNVPTGPRGPGLRYEPTTALGSLKSPPGTVFHGITDMFGNITIEISQKAEEIAQWTLHERVHSFLTPKLYFLRQIRIKLAMEGYNKSYLLRYLEEALAQTYALVRTHGWNMAIEGVKFPVQNGYVTVAAMRTEAQGVLLGGILVGQVSYRVYARYDPP